MTEHELFAKALMFATEKHTGQTRKEGTPYIYHPIKVAELLKDEGYELSYQMAGVLHDVLEDTDATEDDVRVFGEEVLKAVKLVTRPEGMDEEQYVQAILKNPMAKAVKNADKIHNMGDLVKAPNKDWAKRYVQKVKKYYGGRFSDELDAAIENARLMILED